MAKSKNRIAIITFHKALNCGAFLQSFAMQTVLGQLGYSAFFPDCNSVGTYTGHFAKVKSGDRSVAGLVRHYVWWLFSGVLSFGVDELRNKRFEACRRKWLNIKNCSKTGICDSADLLVFGSDQIWNNQLTEVETPYFRGKTIREGVKKIAYAASVGEACDNLQSLARDIGDFAAISMREKGILPYRQVLDPSLLLGASAYASIEYPGCLERHPYMLLFTISSSVAMRQKACQLAKLLGVNLVDVNMAQRGFWRWHWNTRLAVSPDRFLSYIRNADYVLTDSFHGTAFSLIYRKRFLSVTTRKPTGRIYSLLSSIGLDDRILPVTTEEGAFAEKINDSLPDEAFEKLDVLKKDSIWWLKQALDDRL